jgi:hypothetical protein
MFVKEKITMKTIQVCEPILAGSISTAYATCGTPRCSCRDRPPKLHGPYYRWTGFIDGKRTTKTISKEEAKECERRIKNYRRLQQQIDRLVAEALKNAPWMDRPKK